MDTRTHVSDFSPTIEQTILRTTSAERIGNVAEVQRLWSGYGRIARVHLHGGPHASVIVKHVRWPTATNHPRGWATDRSHQRKLRSYEVESTWYQTWASRCDSSCRVPACLAVEQAGDEVFLILEDLNASGFDRRRNTVSDRELRACLAWLANFHATFMGASPTGLWETGTYWHLATRPDELAALTDPALRDAAATLDARLNTTAYLTLVHGDAKLANFCFSSNGERVAAVDFQYVGGGCGMKDVAYFVSSCLDEHDSERREAEVLACYFTELGAALAQRDSGLDFAAIEAQWRALYPVAWTDFYRFLKGWSPGHYKLHRYSERLAREVLASL